MTAPVRLAIPCRMVTLTVEIGPESGLTTLEDLVAQALLAGRGARTPDPDDRRHDARSLAELFAVPYRIMLNVLHTLWSKGHIYIDFEIGKIDLADGAREMLTKHGALHGVAVERQKRSFLFEPVTGRLFNEWDGARRPWDGSLAMPRHAGIDERDLSPPELLRAVQRAFRNERRQGAHKNVLGVGFDNPILRPAAEDRWLHTTADVHVDPDSERLSARLRDDLQWGRGASRAMSEHLADLVDREPVHPFVQSLRGRARHRLVQPDSVERMLAVMARTVAALGDTEPGQVELRQNRLRELATGIHRSLAAMDRARASSTVVSHSAGHRWTIEDLLASARTQVVVVAPQIRYSALNPLLPALRQALDRGVHLVVLWGRTASDSLETRVRSAFAELSGRPGAKVLIAGRSAKVGACVVVQDNSRALVGSRSPLAMDLAGDRGDVSVLVGPADHGPDQPEAVTELLRWTRGAFPYWALGRQIKVQADEFRTDERAADYPAGRSIELELPPLDSDRDAAALRLWTESWTACHDVLSQELVRVRAAGPIVDVVADGAQYDAMWEAIRAAAHDIVISADSIDPGIAEGAIARVLGDRAKTGAAVQLVYTAAPRGAETTEPFAGLATRSDDTVRILRRSTAARLVVADDETVIGSFSPLGDPSRDAAQPWRRSSQLGLRIRGAGFAGQIASAAGCPLLIERPETTTSTPPGTDPNRHGVYTARAILMDARQEKPGGRFGAVIADRLRLVEDPWRVLQIWQEIGVPADELRPAAAALVRDPASVPAPEHAIWVNWLIEDAWERRAFVEAAVLSGLAGPDAETVSPAACVAAVSLEIGPLGAVLTDVALELSDLPPPTQIGGAAGALAEILLWAGTEGAEAVRLLEPALPGPWQTVAERAVSLSGSQHPPVPLSEIVRALSRSAALADSHQRWADLAEEVDKVRQLRQRFAFTSGRVMHDGLFAQDGLLTAIHAASVGGETERNRLTTVLTSDVRKHLDGLVAQAGVEPVEWSRQHNFLNKIDHIVRDARRLATVHSEDDPYASEEAALASYRDVADVIAESWDALYSEASTASYPHSFPLLALLDRLTPLATWAKVHR